MIELKPFPNKQNLSEIFQSLDIKFAFVNNKDEQVSMPAKCRDFLGDCIWSRVTKQKASIYGFQYDYKEAPYYLRATKLSLKFPKGKDKENFIKNIKFLHEKEKQAGVTKSKILETTDKSTVIVQGSSYWQDHPWKLALYTYYLKLMSLDDPTKVTISPEIKYKATIHPVETKLLKAIKKKVVVEYPTDINYQHNYTGVISMLKGYFGLKEAYL